MTHSWKLSAAFAAFLLLGTTPLSTQAIPIITEIYADPASGMAGDANGDGTRSASGDEFVEIFNPDATAVDISHWTLSDSTSIRHAFSAGTLIAAGETMVIFGNGSPTGIPGLVDIASTGGLGLNNGGDTVTLSDGTTVVDSVTYGAEGGNDEALTRFPTLTDGFVQHSTVPGATNALFSPGTSPTGTRYSVTAEEPETPTVSVPEPGPLALLLAGLIGLSIVRKKTPAGLNPVAV